MRDMDWKPNWERRKTVPESVLLETARHIAAEFSADIPEALTPTEDELHEILDFMRRHRIQTVEDYEAAMTKDCGGMSPPVTLPPRPRRK